jgi:hypothetical protein
VAKANAGDAVWFLAAVNRIADILAARGDTDPVGARRARAVGILARPAEALQLLIDHQHDPDPGDEPHHQPQDDDPADHEPSEDHDEQNGDPGESGDDLGEVALDEPVEADEHVSLSLQPPANFDATAARPRVVLHFHLTEQAIRHGNGLVRPEHGEPLTVNQLIEFLTRTGCQIRVQPVLDPAGTAPIDGYEVSPRLRAAVRYWQVADVFPFGTCTSPTMDLDHTQPYLPRDYGGPPGQTRFDNLGPMARSSHRAVTHGGWQKHQPEPGYYLHRSPCGYVYLVTNQGTLALGRTDFSRAVWNAAEPQPDAVAA